MPVRESRRSVLSFPHGLSLSLAARFLDHGCSCHCFIIAPQSVQVFGRKVQGPTQFRVAYSQHILSNARTDCASVACRKRRLQWRSAKRAVGSLK